MPPSAPPQAYVAVARTLTVSGRSGRSLLPRRIVNALLPGPLHRTSSVLMRRHNELISSLEKHVTKMQPVFRSLCFGTAKNETVFRILYIETRYTYSGLLLRETYKLQGFYRVEVFLCATRVALFCAGASTRGIAVCVQVSVGVARGSPRFSASNSTISALLHLLHHLRPPVFYSVQHAPLRCHG